MAIPTRQQLEEMLTDKQVAERLGVSKDTVRRAIKAGEIAPFYKFGRSLRIPTSAVTRYLGTKKVVTKKVQVPA